MVELRQGDVVWVKLPPSLGSEPGGRRPAYRTEGALLGIHHVHPGAGELGCDIGFLALGLAQIAIGWLLVRAGRGDTAARGEFPVGAPARA